MLTSNNTLYVAMETSEQFRISRSVSRENRLCGVMASCLRLQIKQYDINHTESVYIYAGQCCVCILLVILVWLIVWVVLVSAPHQEIAKQLETLDADSLAGRGHKFIHRAYSFFPVECGYHRWRMFSHQFNHQGQKITQVVILHKVKRTYPIWLNGIT